MLRKSGKVMSRSLRMVTALAPLYPLPPKDTGKSLARGVFPHRQPPRVHAGPAEGAQREQDAAAAERVLPVFLWDIPQGQLSPGSAKPSERVDDGKERAHVGAADVCRGAPVSAAMGVDAETGDREPKSGYE